MITTHFATREQAHAFLDSMIDAQRRGYGTTIDACVAVSRSDGAFDWVRADDGSNRQTVIVPGVVLGVIGLLLAGWPGLIVAVTLAIVFGGPQDDERNTPYSVDSVSDRHGDTTGGGGVIVVLECADDDSAFVASTVCLSHGGKVLTPVLSSFDTGS